MRFEWDEEKNRSNLAKHGISFEFATLLFEGRVLEIGDDRADEVRFNAIGLIDGRAFVCVYADRGDIRRIISLRKATRNEWNAYFS